MSFQPKTKSQTVSNSEQVNWNNSQLCGQVKRDLDAGYSSNVVARGTATNERYDVRQLYFELEQAKQSIRNTHSAIEMEFENETETATETG